MWLGFVQGARDGRWIEECSTISEESEIAQVKHGLVWISRSGLLKTVDFGVDVLAMYDTMALSSL
jgi:hypothetical protein